MENIFERKPYKIRGKIKGTLVIPLIKNFSTIRLTVKNSIAKNHYTITNTDTDNAVVNGDSKTIEIPFTIKDDMTVYLDKIESNDAMLYSHIKKAQLEYIKSCDFILYTVDNKKASRADVGKFEVRFNEEDM